MIPSDLLILQLFLDRQNQVWIEDRETKLLAMRDGKCEEYLMAKKYTRVPIL